MAGDDVSDKRARRWRVILGRTALTVFGFCCTVIVIGGILDDSPIDYRMIGMIGGLTLAFGGVLFLPLFVLRLARNPAPVSPWRVAAVVAVGAVAVGLVSVWRGVVVPWAPVASTTEAACPALERAGLGQAWPDTPRNRTRDEVDHNDLGVFSYCSWTVDAVTPSQSFVMVNSFVWLYEGTGMSTALGWATGAYRDRYDDAMLANTLDGIGDEAFTADAGDRLTVTARRANVLIHVEIYPSAAGGIAESLVRQMVAGVRTL